MSDSPSNDSHQDRLMRVVDTVDKLFLAHKAEWHKQVSEFLLEVAAHRKAENEAKEVCRRAARALAEERTAVQAGTAAPLLTDGKRHRPEGWEWWTLFTDDEDHAKSIVEGWVPFEAFQAAELLREAPICRLYGLKPNPSLPTMFAFLAVAHDQHPPHKRLILDPVTEKPLLAIQSQDPDVRELLAFGLAFMAWQKASPNDSLETLQLFLNQVEAHLERLALPVAVPTAAGFPALARPTGPKHERQEPMSTEPLPKPPASDRAERLADRVHRLWGLHPRRFAEMLKAADKKAQAYLRQRAVDDAAERKNRRAVLAEWQALQIKKGKPCLTDPQKRPGPDADWCWNESTHVLWMDKDGKGEKCTIRAWYRRRRAVTPLNFCPPGVAEPPSLAMRYAALAAAHDQVWADEDGKIGLAAPLAAVLDVLRGGWFYGNLNTSIQEIPDEPGFDEIGMDRLEAFYKTVKADLESHQMQPDGRAAGTATTNTAPWIARAVEIAAHAIRATKGGIIKTQALILKLPLGKNGRHMTAQTFRKSVAPALRDKGFASAPGPGGGYYKPHKQP